MEDQESLYYHLEKGYALTVFSASKRSFVRRYTTVLFPAPPLSPSPAYFRYWPFCFHPQTAALKTKKALRIRSDASPFFPPSFSLGLIVCNTCQTTIHILLSILSRTSGDLYMMCQTDHTEAQPHLQTTGITWH